jgi:RNA polymerase sigma-70 factor (ECF subfamily)
MIPISDPDSELMVSVQRNDAESFNVLLNRNHIVVLHHLTRTIRNAAIAEELAQDVFLRVYRSRERYQPTAKFSTWLYRITANVAMNHFRDNKGRDASLAPRDVCSDRVLVREPIDGAPLAEELLVRESLAGAVRLQQRRQRPEYL